MTLVDRGTYVVVVGGGMVLVWCIVDMEMEYDICVDLVFWWNVTCSILLLTEVRYCY